MSLPLITHHISHITPSHITPHTSFITALLLITPLVTAISHNTYHTPCHSHITQHSSAGFHVAGAVHRAVWQSCGASGRRLALGWLSCGRRSTQTEPSGGAAARASGRRLARGWLSCGRRSTQSLLEELRRAWLPPGPWLAFLWQAQHTEPAGGAAARVVAAWPAAGFREAGAAHRAFWRSCGLAAAWPAAGFRVAGAAHRVIWRSCGLVAAWRAAGFRVAGAAHRACWRSCGVVVGWLSCGRRSTRSLLEELRGAWSPPGPRLAFVWQAQHREPAGGAAARAVAAWPAAGFREAWPAAGFREAGAAHRAFWRSCGARGRRLARGWLSCRRSAQSLLEELRRAWSPPGPRLAFVWQAQHTEPSGGAAARVVAAWPSAGFRVADGLLWERCTIFHTPLCHKPSLTHHFVTHHTYVTFVVM